jgi:hypothetical protein
MYGNRDTDLTAFLTVFMGAPQLLASLDNKTPSVMEKDFVAMGYGNKALTILWDEGLSERCPTAGADQKFGD